MDNKGEKDQEMGAENSANSEVNNEESLAEASQVKTEHAPDENELLKNEVAELKDKYLRLYSEFDNYKRRTSKEKIDLVKTANEETLVSLLPVLDDFERAMKSMTDATEISALKEGIQLIFNKLFKTLESKGLKPMESSVGKEFDSEVQDAITSIPAPNENLKGKVVDEVEKGYFLNDKVVRFAKVVTGA